ncbi:hypothetical protein VTN77DRAFT_2225 [Rasamsonia byssochlamydoides]|uniref:uncharacterized protein n=1 Tax=Rasamsonia byssochlamydoides TaxID=89139 RepID=UPI0037440F56
MADYTAAMALLEALVDAGVTYLIVNLGSDHPAFLEAFAKWKAGGKINSGVFQATGRMQALLVHVDTGTLNMAGAIHNVARARIPPESEQIICKSSKDPQYDRRIDSLKEFIHYLQDTIDQRSIMKEYTVFNSEMRTGKNVKQIVLQASQLAQSVPQGPAYLMGAREVFEERINPYENNKNHWKQISPAGLSPQSVKTIREALLNAQLPVVVTTYLRRDKEAVAELIRLAEALGVAVFVPADSALHEADVILVLDSLEQINTSITAGDDVISRFKNIQHRVNNLSELHRAYIDSITKETEPTADDIIMPHFLLSRLCAHLDDNSIILSEAVSNYRAVADTLRCNASDCYYTSGETTLGWHGGAAIGVKLAEPSKTVVAVTGDGSFLFSIPSTVHWMAEKSRTPFLTVILNNRRRKVPMLSAMVVHGTDGHSSRRPAVIDAWLTKFDVGDTEG